MNAMHLKAQWRERFAAYRAALTPEAHAAQSAAIVARLRGLPELEDAACIHCFWPILERREVDVRPLIGDLHRAGKQIVLPVVVTFSRQTSGRPRLRHVRYTGPEALRPNRWGIYEPDGPSVAVEEIDAVIVPALGAGRNGHRVGHGFGYYDELLRAVRGPALCPVYAGCLAGDIPAEPHDVPVSVIVTEAEVVRPA